MERHDTLEFPAVYVDPTFEASPLAHGQLGSFTAEELELFVNPLVDEIEKLDRALDVYRSDESRFEDFKAFAAEHYDIPTEGPDHDTYDPSTQKQGSYARTFRAINAYAPLQQRIEAAFEDPDFSASVTDDEWKELTRLDPNQRAEITGNYLYRYVYHKEKVEALEADPDFTAWVEEVANPDERAAVASTEIFEKFDALTELHDDYAKEMRAKAALKAKQRVRNKYRDELAELQAEPKPVPVKKVSLVDQATEEYEVVFDDEPHEPATTTHTVVTETTLLPKMPETSDEEPRAQDIQPNRPSRKKIRLSRHTVGSILATGATAIALLNGIDTDVDAKTYAKIPDAPQIDDKVVVELKIKSAPKPKQPKPASSKDVKVTNPKASLARILAGVSIMESGKPSNPKARNRFGYYGPWQMYPDYWRKEWAKTYLGNAKAEMNVSNMTMVAVKMWNETMTSLGSAEAAEARWLKGPATGEAIAKRNRTKYRQALATADGNNVTVETYLRKITHNIQTVNVDKQMPWLKGVIKRNPDFNWSLLDKKFPLYSSLHMDDIRNQARAAETIKERRIAGSDIVKIARREFKLNGNKLLEKPGRPNTGPQVRKYTGGPEGKDAPWCAWFVSYVYREAGYKFKDGPAWNDGSIPAVVNLAKWFKDYGIHFTNKSKEIRPKPGDVVMYAHGEHTGIVVEVDGDIIKTIEGNTSGDNKLTAEGDTVAMKRYNYKTYPVAIEFGRLRYPNR